MNPNNSTTADATSALANLALLQTQLLTAVDGFSDSAYRRQFHPETSPVGWHLGHTAFVENLWINEVILGKPNTRTAKQLYLPENNQHDQRGAKLPTKKELLRTVAKQQQDNLALLQDPPPALKNHTFMQNQYLVLFLLQHHAMHLETIYMILTERKLQNDSRYYVPTQKLTALKVVPTPHYFAANRYLVGMQLPECLDNEMPSFERDLPPFSINRNPVSNAEFLGFICASGYRNKRYWSDTGWRWQLKSQIRAPNHWRINHAGDWFGVNDTGHYTLLPDTPVHGISYYEAEAFAKWAHARLPHEHETEIAYRTNSISNTTTTWEWCKNTFYPYPNFKPFPYKRYSKSWFDNHHFVLKGGSDYTNKILKRPSFRNFYTAEKRHIFAGLRLAFDKA